MRRIWIRRADVADKMPSQAQFVGGMCINVGIRVGVHEVDKKEESGWRSPRVLAI
jgi:hypothetical protein